MSIKRFFQYYGIIILLSMEFAGIWSDNFVSTKILLLFFSAVIAFFTWQKVPIPKKMFLLLILFAAIVITPKELAPLMAIIVYITLSVIACKEYFQTISENIVFLAVYTFLIFNWHSSYVFENVIRHASYYITRIQCAAFMRGSEIGPTLSLIIPFVAFLINDIVIAIRKHSSKKLLNVLLLIGIHTLYINLMAYLLSVAPRFASNFLSLLGLFAMSINQFAIYDDNLSAYNLNEVYNKKTVAAMLLISTFSTLLILPNMQLLHRNRSISHRSEYKVAIVNSNPSVANFSTSPSFSQRVGFGYCDFLYGMMPLYLRQSGYQTTIYESLKDAIKDSDAIILTHYDMQQSDIHDSVANYVQNGGNIIAFVDHTNIFNSMTATNDLLAFSSVYAENDTCDSIFHFDGKLWENALSVNWKYLKCFDYTDINIGVWGGASVSTESLLGEPIVVAKYGVSDPADLTSGLTGGYMGNRKFDLGEKVGDIPLCYRIPFSNGTVVLFGDTSYIQTPIPMYNWKFILSIIDDTMFHSPSLLIISIISNFTLIILFTIAVLFAHKNRNPVYVIGIFAGISIGIMTSSFIQNPINSYVENHLISEKTGKQFVYIDNGHSNSFSTDLSSDTQITGIGYNFMKSGYPVYIGNSSELLCRSQIGVIVNPEKPFSDKECQSLLDGVYSGNNIFIFAGRRQIQNTRLLIEKIDVEITSFLGPIPWQHYGVPSTLNDDAPQFVNAWNIEFSPERHDIVALYTKESFCCAAYVTYGKGKIFIIADDMFFKTSNLEGELSGKYSNIQFLQAAIALCD